MDRLLSMRVFQQVAEGGSFSGAARDLDLSAAVVTRLVADLEVHLGARLLQRTTRRVSLTEAGQAYLERVRHILQDIEEADAAVSAQTEDMSGVLRIQARAIPAVHLLAPLVPAFRRLYPRVALDISVDDANEPRIEDHDITLLSAEGEFNANVIARLVVQFRGVLVASPAYALRRPLPMAVSELAEHEYLRFRNPGMRVGMLSLTRWGTDTETEEVSVTSIMVSNHLDTLLRTTLEGGGIAVMPLPLVAPHLAAGQLVRVLPQWVTGQYSVYAAMPSRRFVPRRTRVFLDFLTEHTRELVNNAMQGISECCVSTGA
jgi:DNA-binding transcriptional LysR family regulator